MEILAIVVIFISLVALVLISVSRGSDTRIEMPEGMRPPSSGPFSGAGTGAGTGTGYGGSGPGPNYPNYEGDEGGEEWTGSLSGVEYTVESLSEDTVTIWIDLDEGLSFELEVNARGEKSPVITGGEELKGVPIAGEINSLLSLGADYIDVNYNTDWVAAEIPGGADVGGLVVDRGRAEEIVGHLVRIREMLK